MMPIRIISLRHRVFAKGLGQHGFPGTARVPDENQWWTGFRPTEFVRTRRRSERGTSSAISLKACSIILHVAPWPYAPKELTEVLLRTNLNTVAAVLHPVPGSVCLADNVTTAVSCTSWSIDFRRRGGPARIA